MSYDSMPTSELKQHALELGFTTVGVCRAVSAPHHEHYRQWLRNHHHASMEFLEKHEAIRSHPQGLLPGARSIVAVTLNYYQPTEFQDGEPRIARYALGRDYHKVMRTKLRHLGEWLEVRIPEESHRACVDSAPIFERDFAHLAGLGWFGKNTCLIDSRRGSWFFIGLLLTTADLEPDEPAAGGCGTCTKCIDACPSGAIVNLDGRWQVDSRRCISYQTIEHDGPLEIDTHGWTFGCDVCQEVCPFNQPRESQPLRARPTTEPDFLRRTRWTSLDQLVQLGYEEWDEATHGSAVRRAGFEGLKRNARANLCEGYSLHSN
jgi:epoxyqueuosine reductase